jgi:hypothetical protein
MATLRSRVDVRKIRLARDVASGAGRLQFSPVKLDGELSHGYSF